MKSISAKKLRYELKETLNSVKNGEEFIIIYNSKQMAKLSPIDDPTPHNKIVAEKIEKYLAESSKKRISNKKKFNYKAEYKKDLKKKYKV